MEALCRAAHQNIIAVYRHGQLQPPHAFYYIDMELCDINLEEYIQCTTRDVHGLMDWDKAIENGHGLFLIFAILQEILCGLNFIHTHNEVHRDLNPQNGSRCLCSVLTRSFVLIEKSVVENCGFRSNNKWNNESQNY